MIHGTRPVDIAVEVVPLDPFGAEVRGLTVGALDEHQVRLLRDILAEHGVVALRGQDADDDWFLAFLRSFGALMFTVGETPVPGHPDLNVISNVGRTTPPRSRFHVDTSYVSRPPAYTALRAVVIPEQGGQTWFTDQYRAHDTLPDELRERLADRSIRHVVTGVDPGADQETEAWHPVLRPHPVTGRRSLYLSTPERCVEISGLPAGEGSELVERLYAHSTPPEHTYRHQWRPGDVVIWDNACVLHKADHSGVVGDRVMHRGMVAAYPAGPAGPADLADLAG
ncbi:MAG: TauD/TfdA dioxygenase family protein [Dermatophilaceae bacterium]